MAKKKVRASERSLICVIQALVGMKVLVELKNDVTVKGVLDECDLGMK
jgi:small nuclear ribonucleoprotein (snRNP)-like protein